jgi:DNA polymerase-3 subunit alpha
MDFTHLHCHSHYSLLDGLSKIEPLVQRVKDLNMHSVALTDHGVMYGAVEFYNTCRENSIKPILGLEAYIAPRSLKDKEGKTDADYFHLTLLAKNEAGYKNLIKLTTLAHLEGFYYKPRIDLESLKQYSEGLICLSGCQRGEIARAVMNYSTVDAERVLGKYLNIFGPNNLFIEVQRNSRTKDEKEAELNSRLVELAKKSVLPIVATADCHYIYPEDMVAQDVLVCIGTGKNTSDTDRLDMRGYDLSLKSPEKMSELFYDLPEAVTNTQVVEQLCNVELKIDQRYFPKVEIPFGSSSKEFLKQKTYTKAQEIYGSKQPNGQIPEEIQTRIDYELEIICKKDFDTYFLMVADVVEGAHRIGAITNTRGSAAGSIVGYILGITNVDPLYFELPFERFLTAHRPTPPDIDLDIADDRRDEAIAYITQKYGQDKVAQIITFGTMKARAGVRDVGRALGIPYSKCDRIAKMIPLGKQGFDMTLDKAIEMSAELKEARDQDPETRQILEIAKKLEGNARHASMHAAGIVITPTPLTDYMPLQKEPEGERIITQYDMYALDVNSNSKAIGVVKLDLLGIKNLSILEKTVELVKRRHNLDVDIYKLPHPDEKTFKLLSEGLTFGVFQLGSSGMTRYLKELKPSSIFDIMAMIALYRPGPMQFIEDFLKRKHNPNLIKYFDPAFEKILRRTYGILVYQDDLLTIAHDLAGYSWEEVDKFRKAVGKKIPEEMAKQKIKFIQGCMDTAGWTHTKASEIWNWIEPFAAYGFNKSHSASYAVVAYQTAYMKANFPVEFMTAVMTAESGDEEKIYEAVEECKVMGISILPPDVNTSFSDFTVVDSISKANNSTIRFGLNAIKNLGSDVINKIIEARKSNQQSANQPDSQSAVSDPSVASNFANASLDKKAMEDKQQSVISPHTTFATLQDFLLRTHVKNFNKRSWEALVKSGALDAFGERNQLLASTENILDYVREHFKSEEQGQVSLFGTSLNIGKLSLKKVEPASKEDKLAWEKEHLGMYVSAHPLDSYIKVLKYLTPIRELKNKSDNSPVVIGGIISKLRRTLTKKNDPMAFVGLEDSSGVCEVLVFPKIMEQALPFLETEKIVQISGRLSFNSTQKKSRYNNGKQPSHNQLETGENFSENSLGYSIIAEEIKELPKDVSYELALSEMEKEKQLVIVMQTLANLDELNAIKEVLKNFPGNMPVYLQVGSGGPVKKVKTQSFVSGQPALVEKLKTFNSIIKIDVF